MPDLLVRGVSTETKQALSQSASDQGRSLQAQARMILEQAARAIGGSSKYGANDLAVTNVVNAASPTLRQSFMTRHLQATDERFARIERKRQALEAADAITARCSFPGEGLPRPLDLLEEARREREERTDKVLADLTFTREER